MSELLLSHLVLVNVAFVHLSELLELWPQSQWDVQWMQHSTLLWLLLPAQRLGEAPPRLRSDAPGSAAAAGWSAAGGYPRVRDPRPHQLISLHPQQRDWKSGCYPACRYPSLIHSQHPFLLRSGWHPTLIDSSREGCGGDIERLDSTNSMTDKNALQKC